MSKMKYLLDLEGNLYLFLDTDILKEYILSGKKIEEEINSSTEKPYSDTCLIIFDSENLYEIPESFGKKHILGERRLSETLKEISHISLQDIKSEELECLSPAIYKLYETELLFLCELEENEDVKLYAISTVNNTHTKPQTRPAVLKSATSNKEQVGELKKSISSVKVDSFTGKTQEEHKDDAFFFNIKNLAKGMAFNGFKEIKEKGALSEKSSLGDNNTDISQSARVNGSIDAGGKVASITEIGEQGLNSLTKGEGSGVVEGGMEHKESLKSGNTEISHSEKSEGLLDGNGTAEVYMSNLSLNSEYDASLKSNGTYHQGIEYKSKDDSEEALKNIDFNMNYTSNSDAKGFMDVGDRGIYGEQSGGLQVKSKSLIEAKSSEKTSGTNWTAKTGYNDMNLDADVKNKVQISGGEFELGTKSEATISLTNGSLDIITKKPHSGDFTRITDLPDILGNFKNDMNIADHGVHLEQGIKIEIPAVVTKALSGDNVSGKGELGGSIAELGYKLDISKKGITIGGIAKADLNAGKVEGNIEGYTESGSGLSLGGSKSLGVGAGVSGNLTLDRSGIQAEVTDGLKAGMGVSLSPGIKLKYEDIKRPEFIIGNVLLGPIGGIAGLKLREIGPDFILEGLKFIV